MTDNAQNQGQYSGGFSFGQQGQGGQQQGGGQTQPVPPAPQPVYPAPAPAYPQQPAYQQPAQPVYPQQPAYPQPAHPAPQATYPAPPPAPGAFGGAQPPKTGGGANPPVKDPNHDPNYVFAARMKTFTTTIKLPAHSLSFNEDHFLNLLAGSISLTKDEKKKIIDSMPKLRQAQVDELIRIFDEERSKFIELSPKHGSQLKKLEDEHHADWKDIEMSYQQEAAKEHDAAAADDIRKQLGL